jgi:hypothetical protein
MKTIFLFLFAFIGMNVQIRAAIIQFDLIGTAGNGLLAGNEPGVLVGGSGDEIGAGIAFDDVTRVLSINVGWGSGNGFSNLTSDVNNQHIHGPTTSNYGNGFTETAGVAFNLPRSSNSPSNGTIVTNATLTAAQMTNLYNGKYYINVHTVNNGGGEIRGFLVASPRLAVSVTNQVSITLFGVPGQKQVIQATTNLTAWAPVVTNTSGTNLFQFTDPLQNQQRYYRAVVLTQ